ncbi:MAG: COX15/CtaA family protein [Psychroflexus sp.]|nr:COX15/CtaA family protein [Psychroflexus sp.]
MFRKSVKISIIIVYLVILAGAVVRMTGSGMGCPDWPKCFGYYIPPTEASDLNWKADSEYFKGQVISYDEQLLVAQDHFSSRDEFSADNWASYEEHDFVEINVTKTWVEYVNRLLGALAGLSLLVMTVLSFFRWKRDKRLTLFSLISLVLIGFQAWLGATVVYSVLAPIRITLHMLVAFIILGFLLYLYRLAQGEKDQHLSTSKLFDRLIIVALGMTLVQVILGTQVRQFVDEQLKSGVGLQENILSDPEVSFYIHRSFSIAILLVNAGIWWLNRRNLLEYQLPNWILFIIGLEIITGIVMYYLAFPFGTQALHLIFASLLFGLQFYLLLQTQEAKTKVSLKFN